MNIAIIGCGLIGKKRAQQLEGGNLVFCVDKEPTRATLFATQNNCKVLGTWQDAVNHPNIDIIIITTTHAFLSEITLSAIQAGKHVLVEKPAALNCQQLIPVIDASKKTRIKVRVGFNHRYHSAFNKAYQLFHEGLLGELMFIKARYGHGGRLGYEKEWRSDPKQSGGGELIDKGTHLIDLARWFLGDFVEISGHAHTYYWNRIVDDNGFMLLKTPKKQVAFLHASCTEWKNNFSFEICGKKAKLEIQGLGGSYGIEKLAYYQLGEKLGPPETTIWEFPQPDTSWQAEFNDFLTDIRLDRPCQPGLADAYAALHIVESITKDSGYDYHA